ncbi:hypothetical protein CTT30_17560 [Vibrio coralliilyticus]|nr:hypothetical protein CTT30_17560 [Vibrio coralliilyticus]
MKALTVAILFTIYAGSSISTEIKDIKNAQLPQFAYCQKLVQHKHYWCFANKGIVIKNNPTLGNK